MMEPMRPAWNLLPMNLRAVGRHGPPHPGLPKKRGNLARGILFLSCFCLLAIIVVPLAAIAQTNNAPATPKHHPLLDYKFTNELGQAMSLSDFKGQALGITFFFTRCPIPNYCPRLSKNFQQASEKLLATPNAPTNWHFLSVSFDTEFDTPAVLKNYARSYNYNPAHWSFLTGAKEKIAELAKESDASFEKDGGFYNHNFRTLIIDAAGHLQMSFPISGDISDAIVREILKAATTTNRTEG